MEIVSSAVAPSGVMSNHRDKVREEGMAVVGKSFPTSTYGELIARFPTAMWFLSIILPVAFAFIALSDTSPMEVSLDGFTADPHESTTSAKTITSLVTQWYSSVGNTSTIGNAVNPLRERSVPSYRQEIHFSINKVKFEEYVADNQQTLTTDDLLVQQNLQHIAALERVITGLPSWSRVCLSGDLKGGIASPLAGLVRNCAPLVSITNYYFPGLGYVWNSQKNQLDDVALSSKNESTTLDFAMDGESGRYQSAFFRTTSRMLLNPNLGWFLDNSFSPLTVRTNSIRTQLTFGAPMLPSLFDVGAQQVTHLRSADSGATTVEQVGYIRDFTRDALNALGKWSHPFIDVSYGGDQVEETKIANAVSAEFYKIYVAVAILVAITYMHTRAMSLTVLLVLQIVLNFLGAWGLHTSVFHERLPLFSSIALFVIISFSLHGTLSIRDSFIHSGIMLTTGRLNTLTVAQRISFTLRRAVVGVLIADVIAVAVFAVGSGSAFPAVRQFSVLMIIAVVLNMYMAMTVTPSTILWHHLYLSNNRRKAQKQRDARRAHQEEVAHRDLSMAEVLKANEEVCELEGCPRLAQRMADEQVALDLTNARATHLTKNAQTAFGATLREIDNMLSVVLGKSSFTGRRQRHADRSSDDNINNNNNGRAQAGADRVELSTFRENEFIDVSSVPSKGGDFMLTSCRVVPPAFVLHIPATLMVVTSDNRLLARDVMERDVPPLAFREGWRERRHSSVLQRERKPPSDRLDPSDSCQPMGDAVPSESEREDDGPASAIGIENGGATRGKFCNPMASFASTARDGEEHRAGGIGGGERDDSSAVRASMNTFVTAMQSVARMLCFTMGPPQADSAPPLPPVAGLAAHQLLTWIDRSSCIAELEIDNRLHGGSRGANCTPSPVPGTDSSSPPSTLIGRLGERLQRRDREYFFGLFGKRVGESREERDARILRSRIPPDGYGAVERLMHKAVAPFTNRGRYGIAAASVALIVIAVVLAAKVPSAGIPYTLLRDTSGATSFRRSGLTFGQPNRQGCDWCSGYYRPISEQRSISLSENASCATQGKAGQMNVFLDQCGVCVASNTIANECVDCLGVPFGNATILPCGACGLPGDLFLCSCNSPASCTLCDFYYGLTNLSGPSCSTDCPSWCKHGDCNAFTGECRCYQDETNGFWMGTFCDTCAGGYVDGPRGRCTAQCNSTEGTLAPCMCNVSAGMCEGCPVGYMGYDCQTNTSVECFNGGFPDPATLGTTCVCPSRFADGGQCVWDSICSFKGVYYTTNEAFLGGCGCRGNWYGKSCQLCLCQNGGNCAADGTCICQGAFGGPQCQFCGTSCSLHGECPDLFTPETSNLRSCIPQFCDWVYLETELVCPQCNVAWLPSPECSAHPSYDACMADVNCFFMNSCVSIQTNDTKTPPSCTCHGAWVGPLCDVCGGPPGSVCLDSGDIVACNGRVYTNAQLAPATDACGVCGGDGNCVGCDGVLNSGIFYDACGVCGGNGACLSAAAAAPVAVTFLVDTSHAANKSFHDVMRRLELGCTVLNQMTATGQIRSPLKCIAADFSNWLETVAGQAYVATSGGVVNASTLQHYARSTSRQAEVAFSHARTDPSSEGEPAGVTFMLIVVQLPVVTTSTNSKLFTTYGSMLQAANTMSATIGGGILVIQTSQSWASAVAAAVSSDSLKFSAGIGLAVTFALTAVFFGSLRFAVISTILSGFVLCGTLASAFVLGWDLDSTMQICIAVVLAVASEHVVHLIDGYQDYIQTTQSHLFARGTSRFHCVRGALVRTGLSTVSSTVAVIAVAVMFTNSAIQPFKRAADIIITLHLLAVLGMIFFCAWANILGSTALVRSWLLSLIVCAGMCIVVGIIVLALFLSGGVRGPNGDPILGR